MTTIGICAIIKDCNQKYLNEWIEWHQLIGVDFFFIYDNESQIPIKTLNLNNNNIYIKEIKGEVMQLPAYQDCIKLQKNKKLPKCDWIAFIDDDEFIVPEQGSIKKVMEEYHKFSALGINWMTFGSSGIKFKTDEGQISKFNKILSNDYLNEDGVYSLNSHIKTIANPLHVLYFTSPHSCVCETPKQNKYWNRYTFGFRKLIRPKGLCVDIDKNIIPFAFTIKPIQSKMWIAHYYLKSEEEFKLKISRGRADTNQVEHRLKMQKFYDLDEKCTIENNFIKELYNKLKSKNK